MAVQGKNNGVAAGRGGMGRQLGIGLGVVILFGLIFMITRAQPVPADLAVVESGPMSITLDEEGETRVRDRFVVSAPVAGRVLRLELEPGDPVIAGETVLATFQPVTPVLLDARTEAEARARVRAAEAGLGRAEADRKRLTAELEFAKRDLERQRRLSDDQVVAAERLDLAKLAQDQATDALSAAEFAVHASRHELEISQASLMQATGDVPEGRPLTLTSPVDGVVLSRTRESEAVVPAGEPLLVVADPERMEIVSDFLSTDAVKIRPGLPVWIEQWGGDRPLNGIVRRVEPSGFTKISALGVEEQRVNVIIDLEDPREVWKTLGDGFRVEVRVVVWQGEDVLQIPTSVLYRIEDAQTGESSWAAFRIDGDTAQTVSVEIGHRNQLSAEILSGLTRGEQVVIHPSDDISDGVPVAPRE